MSVIGSNIIAGASGQTSYQIARSLRFNSADSAHLTRTPGSAGNLGKWTFVTRIKRSRLSGSGFPVLLMGGNTTNDNSLAIIFNSTDTLVVRGYTTTYYESAQVFRDISAWYDIVIALDSSQATQSNRLKVYVNGSLITATTNVIPLNGTWNLNNSSQPQTIGVQSAVWGFSYFDGYFADTLFIDGQALDSSSFGETDANTGVWVPKAYTGTFGTNGFWLNFADNSNTTAATLGKDLSGNGNNWTPNNFSVTAGVGNDSLVDSPTNYGTDTGAGGEVRGNYCTFNPLQLNGTLANGNLDGSFSASSTATQQIYGTLGVSSGKWYFEFTQNSAASGGILVGVQKITGSPTVANYTNGNLWSYYLLNGNKGNTSSSAYGPTATNGDIIGCAIDMDAGNIWFSKNGVWMASGNPATGANPAFSNLAGNTVTPSVVDDQSNGAKTFSFNAGQRPFAYTAPSGFKALCTTNLPTPAIGASASTLASKNMNVVTYTGNGTTTGNTQAISGLGFQPDLVWIKSRSSGVYTHLLTDSIRGANKILYSPLTDSEATVTNVMNSFDSDGFTVAFNSSYTAAVSNANAATFVGWAWNAGGSTVTNTSGSISSQVRANAAAGISVVTYTGNGSTTGATVGHGLGVAPRFIIVKNRARADNWLVQHASLGATGYLNLNGAGTFVTSARAWNNTSPTSSVFTVNTFAGEAWTNNLNDTYVAYCFADIEGFSRFGSYTGNGSADGAYVYLGFRARYIMIRRTDAVDDWLVFDTARDTYNASGLRLFPRQAVAEEDGRSANPLDILSNGFKTRSTNPNASNGTYIFAAFAEAPFNYARAR